MLSSAACAALSAEVGSSGDDAAGAPDAAWATGEGAQLTAGQPQLGAAVAQRSQLAPVVQLQDWLPSSEAEVQVESAAPMLPQRLSAQLPAGAAPVAAGQAWAAVRAQAAAGEAEADAAEPAGLLVQEEEEEQEEEEAAEGLMPGGWVHRAREVEVQADLEVEVGSGAADRGTAPGSAHPEVNPLRGPRGQPTQGSTHRLELADPEDLDEVGGRE